jgi:putative FmdB family regulatory protein
MPVYDYRCNRCGQASALFYKTYKDYDAATPVCPNCGSSDMIRIISGVSLPVTSRDYGKMTANEMLAVLESGDREAVRDLYGQVGQSERETIQQVEQVKQAANPKTKRKQQKPE